MEIQTHTHTYTHTQRGTWQGGQKLSGAPCRWGTLGPREKPPRTPKLNARARVKQPPMPQAGLTRPQGLHWHRAAAGPTASCGSRPEGSGAVRSTVSWRVAVDMFLCPPNLAHLFLLMSSTGASLGRRTLKWHRTNEREDLGSLLLPGSGLPQRLGSTSA